MSSNGTSQRQRGQAVRRSGALNRPFLQPRHPIVVGQLHRPLMARDPGGLIPVRCEVGSGSADRTGLGEIRADATRDVPRDRNGVRNPAQAMNGVCHGAEPGICPSHARPSGRSGDRQSTDCDGPSTALDRQPAAESTGVVIDVSRQPEPAIALTLDPSADGKAASGREPTGNDENGSAILMRLAALARIFRGLDDRIYAEVPVEDHHEIHELESPAFECWLIRRFRCERKTLPALDGLKRLIRALEADAMAAGSAETVWVRVADGSRPVGAQQESAHAAEPRIGPETGPDAAYYLDLGGSSREAVEIKPQGWRLVTRPPVSFRRMRGMQPLPRPCDEGSVELLKKYLNVADADFPLLVAWITAALRPVGPFPVLILGGEQGSAKSTMAKILRRMIDPSSAELRALPDSQRDLIIEAHNSWLLSYDNVSSLSTTLSDCLCRIATGGGFSTRTLFSDRDNTLLDVRRPVILNGIDDFVHRSDLIDRCLFLHAPAIPGDKRRLDCELWDEFHSDYPRLLGCVLSAVSAGLRVWPTVKLTELPRLADFGQWGEAVCRGLGWEPGLFLAQYTANRRDACITALGDCPVADAVRRLLDYAEPTWHGTASELLLLLSRFTPSEVRSPGRWPKSPLALSVMLRRISPQLGMIGIGVRFDRGRDAAPD